MGGLLLFIYIVDIIYYIPQNSLAASSGRGLGITDTCPPLRVAGCVATGSVEQWFGVPDWKTQVQILTGP